MDRKSQPLNEFLQVLIMRLEEDYDSFTAVLLVFIAVIMGVFNPFLQSAATLYPATSLQVLTVQPPRLVTSFIGANFLLDTFVLSMAAASALLFRNASFGAVEGVRGGSMALIASMPSGRRNMLISVIVSSALIPYAAFALPSIAVLYMEGYSLTALAAVSAVLLNILPVLGLTSVILLSGTATRNPPFSAGCGLAYATCIFGGYISLTSSWNTALSYTVGALAPSLAITAATSYSSQGVFLTPFAQAGQVTAFTLIIAAIGITFNLLLLYVLYYYWTRVASF